MHLCTCEIAVAGDLRNTVIRGGHDPVTFPEVSILKFLHGEAAVTNVEVCGEVDRDPGEEKARLISKYPGQAVETLFPGTKPPMETEVRGYKQPSKTGKKASGRGEATPFNPVTG